MPKSQSFVLHDESLNTYGFRMLTSGANLEEFKKNPVMLLNHSDYSLPIGRWENIRIEGTQILADPVFDLNDPQGREAERKVREGFLRAASIGAWPPEEKSVDPALMLPGQTQPTVTKWTVREASICTIGANHNALVFYDRATEKPIDLQAQGAVVKLMDNIHSPNSTRMTLNQILNLADNASEAEQQAAVRNLQADNERLKGENKTLADAIDKVNQQKKEAQKAEAVALVDAAVKDGRINASGKATFIALFDKDFESAKLTLSAIAPRQSVHRQMNTGAAAKVELADYFKSKTWDELDRAGKLLELKDNYPDLYAEKFQERYGTLPRL
jgi:hypothetical protein